MSTATATTKPFSDEVQACRQEQRSWAAMPVRARLQPVQRLRRLLVSEMDSLCAAIEKDVDRLPAEVIGTDILPTADACRFLQRHARRILRPRTVSGLDRPLWMAGERDTVYRRPHGVVGVIGTWNYPVYLNAIQIVQALTAGNGVLWKPSELLVQTAAKLHTIFLDAGYPTALLQRLPATREAGPQLAEADVDHITFTGSETVGRKLAARLGERLVSSTLELSGCDAMFVLADANVGLAARAAWFGMTLNRGQTCLAMRRMFVERPAYDKFLQALETHARSAPSVPLVLEPQQRQAERMITDALAKGGRLLASRIESTEPATGIPPTIICDANPDMAICQEAAFAPVGAVIACDDIRHALAMNSKCPFGLGAAIFSANEKQAVRLATQLAVGTVAINDVIIPVANPATPFGGRAASGWGVTQGEEGLLAMTVPQVVGIRSGTLRLHYSSPAEAPHIGEAMRGILEMSHGSTKQRWIGLKRVLRQVRRFL